MSKQEMIAAIRQSNPSAAETFLGMFPENALEQYLQRLTRLKGQRGRTSVWIRPDGGTMLANPSQAA